METMEMKNAIAEEEYVIAYGLCGTRDVNEAELELLPREPLTLDEYEEHTLTSLSDEDAPAIYVGTYGKYNDGDLSGAWIDLTTFDDRTELIEFLERLHADENDPELMVQDYMNIPESMMGRGIAGESIPGDDLFEWIALDEDEREIVGDYMYAMGCNLEEAVRYAMDDYTCKVEDWEDYADEMFDECHEIPDNLRFYINYEAWRRDLAYDYSFGDKYVFYAH